MKNKALVFRVLIGFALAFVVAVHSYADMQTDSDYTVIKPPPRSIEDVLRAIDKSKPFEDAALAKTLVSTPIPDTQDLDTLRKFYFDRATAHEALGQIPLAIEDRRMLVGKLIISHRNLQIADFLALAELEANAGSVVRALKAAEAANALVGPGNNGPAVATDRLLVVVHAQLGDFESAEHYLRDAAAALTLTRMGPKAAPADRYKYMENDLLISSGYLLNRQGRFAEAEQKYRTAHQYFVAHVEVLAKTSNSTLGSDRGNQPGSNAALRPTLIRLEQSQIGLSTSLLNQGKFVDAEIYARESIDMSLRYAGRNSLNVAAGLNQLAIVLSEQGRSAEAVLIAKAAIKTYEECGVTSSSLSLVRSRKALASALVADKKYAEADKVFAQMHEGINASAETAKQVPLHDVDWVIAKLKTGQAPSAVDMTKGMLALAKKMSDVNESRLAFLESFNAMAMHRSGRVDEAAKIYDKYIPVLVDSINTDVENQTGGGKQLDRMVMLLEDNLSILAEQAKAHPEAAPALAAKAFMMADLARGSGVQRALTASAARANIRDPQLAELARKEQDTQRRIGSLESILSSLMSAPPEDQLPAIQAKMKVDIASLKGDRAKFKKEIEQKFPEYADLVNPKPATLDKTRHLIKDDEVLVSWYFAETEGFVWALTKSGTPQFHRVDLGRKKMAEIVGQLRKSLDAGVATVDEIPAFDVALANLLYRTILAPVHSAVQGKKVMLTVPHGELGQLPLALLTTKPDAKAAKAKGGDFTEYRNTAWLIKDIAITQLPSVTALVALRNLPSPSNDRRAFVGFGDPYFSIDQAKLADKMAIRSNAVATRGIPLNLRSAPKTSGVSSAELALLPRLPDTKEEILEIGKALSADPEQDIFLNKQASVARVMEMDLSDRKVVIFSTHGLVPGELDGLTQPALALSAPEVTGETKGDGLLTMEKILTMKLNADWVVLSACNTASGEGAGAEAVSGLGRAFFYAGARALLVSNWPVDSEASRILMTDMFKRQQEKVGLNKAEYLRASILAMIGTAGAQDAKGKMKYSYAHPLFWAPFVVVGD